MVRPARLGLVVAVFATSGCTVEGVVIDRGAEPAVENTSVRFEVGTFQKTLEPEPAVQRVHHGLGTVPRAVVLWSAGQQTPGTAPSYELSLGFSDGTSQGSVGKASLQGVASSACSRVISRAALHLPKPDKTSAVVATTGNWDASEFDLEFAKNDDQQLLVHYLAIGGDDAAAAVRTLTLPTTPSDVSVDFGFSPDLVLLAHAGRLVGDFDVPMPDAALGFGAIDARGQQWANMALSMDGLTLTDAQRTQRVTTALRVIDNVKHEVLADAIFRTLTSSGLTLQVVTAPAEPVPVVLLGLRGIGAHVGYFNKPAGPAPVSQTISDLSFEPRALLFSTIWDPEYFVGVNTENDATWGLGAATPSAAAASSTDDVDAVSVTQATGTDSASSALAGGNSGPNEALARNFGPSAFTLDWVVSDAAADQILFVALGASPAR